MGTSQKIEESYKNLKESLSSLLRGKQISFTDCPESDYPFIVLETSTDSVGFSVINGSPQDSFQSAYKGFKLCYRQNHSDWQHKNLSFVLCRLEHKEKDDGFFSSVETDAYFCRKYVIDMHVDQNVLCNELFRLPFLPIPDKGISGIALPPSAQTLLQDINVSATVARQIVVPMVYSASKIFKNLIVNPEKLPELNITSSSFEPGILKPTEITRIREISIEAFRAYKNQSIFNLDADIVVLYGPNGLGKTSFFDAIDYACTGRIGRFCRSRISPKRFVSLARHLATDQGSGVVELRISRDQSEYHLKRHIDDWRYVQVGKENYDRPNLLQFITSAKWGEKKPRIENIERLFRATHLFNQTDSELFTGFLNESILSSDLVSRMLALDDYTSGKSKVSQVLSLCEKKTSELNNQIESLNEEINEANIKLEKLPKPSSPPDEKISHIKKLTANYISEFNLKTKMSFNEKNISIEVIKECRSIVDASLKENENIIDEIISLIDDFDIYEAAIELIDKSKTTLVSCEKLYSERNSELKLALKKLKKKKNELGKSKSSLTVSNRKILNLEQMPDLQRRVKATRSSLNFWKNQINESEKAAQSASEEIQRLSLEKSDIEQRINSVEIQIGSLTKRIGILQETLNEIPKMEQDKRDIQKPHNRIASDKKHLKEISINEKDNSRLRIEKTTLLNEKKDELKRLNEEQSRITGLLDEIECHVINSHCPTCGFDYGSKQTLIEKIRAQKESRPLYVENLVKECNTIDEELKETIKSAEKFKHQKKRLEDVVQTSENEINIAENRILKFHQKLEEISIDTECTDLAGRIKSFLGGYISELNQNRKNCDKLKNDLKTISEKQKMSEKNRNIHETDMKKAKTESDSLYNQLNGYVKQAENLGWNIDADQAELDKSKIACQKNVEAFATAIKGYEIDINTLENSIIEIQNPIIEIQNEMDSAQKNINGAQIKVRKFLKEYLTCTGSKTPDPNNLDRIKNDAEDNIKQFEKLKERAIFLEFALDSAEKSALIVELEALIQRKIKEKSDKSDEIKRTKLVRKWIAKIGNVLDKQSSIAVDNHVASFGPLTTILQKRLRAVYGFSDVYLEAKGDEIHVNVEYAKKPVRPTDYFSDSQKQILMLSLFLSGRLTQNWSGFAPILLDDPVTHFDDLNAFGFVELIRGLVSLSPGKRQFFISTCDNRLFDLMKSKFGSKDTRAVFYRFDGIDTNGPIISKC
jgi:exonuclease SbcC